jgi:hypothetical protein
MIRKSGNRFSACAKLWHGSPFQLDASAGEGRSEKIMRKRESGEPLAIQSSRIEL